MRNPATVQDLLISQALLSLEFFEADKECRKVEKISINCSQDDLGLVDKVQRKFPIAKRHLICRAAMRAGLSQFAGDPGFALEHLTREVRGISSASE